MDKSVKISLGAAGAAMLILYGIYHKFGKKKVETKAEMWSSKFQRHNVKNRRGGSRRKKHRNQKNTYKKR
jgi:hypothetical protein